MRVNIGELGLDKAYSYYLTTTKKPVDRKTFKQVSYLYLKKSIAAILEGQNYKLPNRLGYIRVQKKEMDYDKLYLDYEHFNKTGQKCFHLNDHSDGFRVRILWQKSACLVMGKLPYCFVAPRKVKRDLAKIMKAPGGHKRYPTEKY